MQQQFEKIAAYLNLHFNKVALFFVVFYGVGILGLSLPATYPIFTKLTPLALLLSTVAMAFFHHSYSEKALAVFGVIYLIGFGVEVIGVNTKLIFGPYTYGSGLGPKLLDTPLIIGVNWLLLVYAANSVFERFVANRFLVIVLAGLVLVVYDLILEQAAPLIEMWSWQNNEVPAQNYIAWFVLAILLSGILRFSGIPVKNRLAPVILSCQTLFFIVLLFILNRP
ncbi:carotenoid biosynthesis protein [Maribellus sediminis]|uniref:carotenoid biosynthesis protein n=1 Tax=Maribellus sediminis TaxID=2696285 RepID=UPI00142F71B0|nr:carotenoid biosynthesis protein [Maribellus sediminis]